MKKLVSVLLCAVMLSGALSVCASALDTTQHLPFMDDKTYSAGDVNDDGSVNALDAHALKSSVAGLGTGINTDAADLNADGSANSRDNLILKAVFVEAASIDNYVSDAPIYKLTIAENPISDYAIVVPEGTNRLDDNVYVAAEILQTYIAAGSGFKPSIVNGESKAAHAIYFHAIEPASAESEEMGLGLEDYIYRVTDGDLHVYGTLRGNMYAAYEICEKFLGFRFYDNRYTYSYRMRTSDIPEGLYEYHKVPLEFRYTGSPVDDQAAIYQVYFAQRQNGTQIYAAGDKRCGYLTGPRFINAHSFGVYRTMMAGSYPEDDSLTLREKLTQKYLDGQKKINAEQTFYHWQPCASSDEQYYEMYNGMLEVLEMIQGWGTNKYYEDIQDLGIYSMSFSINDNGDYCRCRFCLPKVNGGSVRISGDVDEKLKNYSGEYTVGANNRVTFKKEGYSGLYMDLAVRAATEITTEYHGYEFDFGEEGIPPLDEGIRKVYPGIKLYLIIYDFTIPESIKPVSNIILMYCGHGCNNHILGTGDCGDGTTVLGGSNKINEVSMPAWAEYCHEAGGSIWYWSYGVNYSYYLGPCPNILDFYYNMKYIYDVCGFDGVYYESCGGPHNNFEDMKSYLAAQVMWDPGMSYERFTEITKEYMKMYYGKGYEQIYEYMLLQTAAGDATGWCFVNNHDRPGDMYSYAYLREHYEEMRNYILTAIDMAGDDYHRTNCERLLLSCEFMGLVSVYTDMYTNGTEAQRAEYTARYTWLWNYLNDNDIPIFPDPEIYSLPDEIDLSVNPMTQFYEFGAWRAGVTP
ncbi:MAG: DUF4838 domain-containing protein [Clostridia bacterium]|nr:DUF4838 domain-containing protein [Clostridia bacterium]